MSWVKRFLSNHLYTDDYPLSQYSVYWELFVDKETFHWKFNILSLTGEILHTDAGQARSVASAKTAAFKLIKPLMKQYRRF